MTVQARGHSDTVLVVDDQPDSLRMLRSLLESAGITVLIATSGQAALDLLTHIVPDLIIMDGVMPGMDGFETTVRIKSDPGLAQIPVVFMTGLSQSAHVLEAFAAGGVDYVRKPVDLDELLARVRVHLSQGRAAHASVASLDATGRLMMAADRRGNLLWCTPLAERAISRMFPEWTGDKSAVPKPLRDGIARLLASHTHAGGATRIEWRTASLELGVVAFFRDDEALIRLAEQNPADDVLRLKERLNLTGREAEVLLWLSYGKANNDISEVLGISPRTVQKHLERIYEKMGVETRSAAAAVALRVIGK